MATVSRSVPPREAAITCMPAYRGPSTTVDHSSALKSAFLVIAFLGVRLGCCTALSTVTAASEIEGEEPVENQVGDVGAVVVHHHRVAVAVDAVTREVEPPGIDVRRGQRLVP